MTLIKRGNNSPRLSVHLYDARESVNEEFAVNKTISTLALIVCLTSSLAFAGDKKKSTSSSDEAATKATQAVSHDKATQDNSNPCSSDQKAKKNGKEKPSPSVEQQFDEVLRGIYG